MTFDYLTRLQAKPVLTTDLGNSATTAIDQLVLATNSEPRPDFPKREGGYHVVQHWFFRFWQDWVIFKKASGQRTLKTLRPN